MSDQSDFEDEGSEMSILEDDDDFESADSDSNSNNNADSTDSEDESDVPVVRGPWVTINDPETYEHPSEIVQFEQRIGPINPPPINSHPIEYFDRLASDPATGGSLINILVTETNRYADQYIQQAENPKSWVNVNALEMRAFLGLFLSMGLVKKPSLRSYWNASLDSWITNTPAFKSVMPRNRFQNILRFLHCNNNEEEVPRGQEGHDHAHKIRPVLDLLNNTFKDNYELARDITVDESMVGYVSTLSLYCGKGGARSQHGSGFDLVTDLVNPFYNKWHHVLVDNAFCSPHLCHYLLERNTYMTGTVRVHRKGMPSSFKRIRVPKGEREVRQQGQLMAMKYGDRKQVTFLSTFSDPRIIPTTNARGVRREVPTVVNLYNKKMGGVDLGDQHIQSYDPDVQKENYAGYAKRKQDQTALPAVLLYALVTVSAGFTPSDTFNEHMQMHHTHLSLNKLCGLIILK
ncbi:unnamed protein product [Mytilus coruscus]|uniref:PiggyBac transposable element-derived protein domain-containing protein n=1 Tax=Mytilus coruscus TaxID=42192 RepID=A0A6J8EIF9_MYTCO|nr:unnamed protein product [Mytilus coruscus]